MWWPWPKTIHTNFFKLAFCLDLAIIVANGHEYYQSGIDKLRMPTQSEQFFKEKTTITGILMAIQSLLTQDIKMLISRNLKIIWSSIKLDRPIFPINESFVL